MTDAFSEERLMQLDERWRRDPSSRIFVQLAEEYRRAGRFPEAIGVLEQGLLAHPNYLSALVALGRCRIESGDSARATEALEQALSLDPSQLVANKLLVEAYLRTGRAAKARERLDFYRQINDRDAEIEALAERIERATAPPALPPALARSAPAEGRPLFELARTVVEPVEMPRPGPRAGAVRPAVPFGVLVEPAEASRRIDRAFARGGVFTVVAEPVKPEIELYEPPPGDGAMATPEETVEPETSRELPVEQHSDDAPPASEETPPWGVASPSAELELEAREEVVSTPFAPRTIGEEIERETIEEPFDELSEAESAATALPLTASDSPRGGVAGAASEIPAEPIDASAAPPGWAPELVESTEAEPPPSPSATLGELFLSQGYLDEAEREFRAVLDVRPHDAAASKGLAEVERRRPAAVEETPASTASGSGLGLTRRKIATLLGYLERLRRASGGDRVS